MPTYEEIRRTEIERLRNLLFQAVRYKPRPTRDDFDAKLMRWVHDSGLLAPPLTVATVEEFKVQGLACITKLIGRDPR